MIRDPEDCLQLSLGFLIEKSRDVEISDHISFVVFALIFEEIFAELDGPSRSRNLHESNKRVKVTFEIMSISTIQS